MRIDLTNKTAVVTGAAGDLGRVIARTLAACGADVAVHYKSNRAMAEKIVEEICGIGRRATAVQADVGDAAAVEAMHAEIVRELGDADIVVTNAVAQYKWVSVLEQGLEDYESQFRTCVMQNVLMAKAFVPAMIRKGGGRIIAINTECAMQCFPSQSAYVSGKRGMDGLLRVLAREIGPHGITVNQIAPGWTVSDRDRATHSDASRSTRPKSRCAIAARTPISPTPWRSWPATWRVTSRASTCPWPAGMSCRRSDGSE